MWINLDQAIMQVARVEPPIQDNIGRWAIRICDMLGNEYVVRYSMAASADMAMQKFREYVLRGKTDAGNYLLVWPQERMASAMSSGDLAFIAKQTQGEESVTITDEECGILSWRINGMP